MATPLSSAAPPPNLQSALKLDVEASTHSTEPISKTVVGAGRRHIFYANERGVRVNLVAVHRMNMHYLRKRLIDETATILKKGEMDDDNSRALTGLMRDYCLMTTYLAWTCQQG